MDYHLFQLWPRVRRLLKAQITHIRTPQWKNESLCTLCQKQERRCQTRAPFYAQLSGNGSGEISGFANEVPARWASQQDAGAGQKIQVRPGNTHTHTHAPHAHTAVWEEETLLLNTYLMEMRWRFGRKFMHLCIVFIRQMYVGIRHIRWYCIFQSYCACFSSLTPEVALVISIREVFPPSYAWKSAPTSIFDGY